MKFLASDRSNEEHFDESREFYEDAAMESYDPSYRELPVYFTEDS